MNNIYRNSEGYKDSTAGRAMMNVQREERKKEKMAKRSCRRNDDEKLWHEEHIRWSKKTDEQFHNDFEAEKNNQYSYGYNKGKRDGRKEEQAKAQANAPKVDLAALELALLEIPGMGKTKVQRCMEVIRAKVPQ